MPNPQAYHRIGKALHALYVHLEDKGSKQLIIRVESDGSITSPEGMAEALERLLAMEAHAGPSDMINVKADPTLVEDLGAETGQGGQEG